MVCDDRDSGCAGALGPAVAADGQQVAIVPSGRPYRFALYPTPEQLRAVVGNGWPVTYDGSPRRWLGYWLAASPVWRHLSRSGLDLPGPGTASLAQCWTRSAAPWAAPRNFAASSRDGAWAR